MRRGQQLNEILKYFLSVDVPDHTGQTVRKQLEHVYKKTGRKPTLLDEEPIQTDSDKSFIRLFWRITNSKATTDTRIQPIDLLSWCKLYRHPLTNFEIDTIIMLDKTLIEEIGKKNGNNS